MTKPLRKNTDPFPIFGLYAIADTALLGHNVLTAVEQALAGGASIIQYRDKTSDTKRRLKEARALAQLCHHFNACFIVNDDSQLALSSGADGVHLGRDDGDVAAARSLLGQQRIIGVSCYNEFDLAQKAALAGADYIAFGAFFPSAVKPKAVRATTELLQRARRELNIPTVAIGGINADNAAPLIQQGADAVAVISDIFDQTDIRTAAKRIAALFAQEHIHNE